VIAAIAPCRKCSLEGVLEVNRCPHAEGSADLRGGTKTSSSLPALQSRPARWANSRFYRRALHFSNF